MEDTKEKKMRHSLQQVEVRLALDSCGGVYSSTPLTTPNGALAVLHSALDAQIVERLIAVFCDAQARPISYAIISQGGVSRAVISISYLMRSALLAGAERLFIAHNHPGGSLDPSVLDWQLTKTVHDACQLLGLELMDHVIFSYKPEDPSTPIYVSLREKDRERRIWGDSLPETYYDKPQSDHDLKASNPAPNKAP